ncbi:uncharacterized protein RCC_04370 [Ramularia collo-cygni]|uniref:Uncharacterized protein n=1 Tax=Ramularia collo-cygni TaxID=112498 RepID=A0A2D3UWA8_9PEZI|nr:uncharacterized protein RCC_04370 [Ramularia collo-cygni]CZT18525.1 uncharacterized protein RCC_04370 [Ramularia collo-cygni]
MTMQSGFNTPTYRRRSSSRPRRPERPFESPYRRCFVAPRSAQFGDVPSDYPGAGDNTLQQSPPAVNNGEIFAQRGEESPTIDALMKKLQQTEDHLKGALVWIAVLIFVIVWLLWS